MITHRPCGECAALVPAETGCAHWKPRVAKSRRRYQEQLDLIRAYAKDATGVKLGPGGRVMSG